MVALLAVPAVPFPAGHVADVADRFQPTGSTESLRTVEPRRFPCLSDVPCPSVQVGWMFASAVTTAQLRRWLDDARFSMAIEGDCANQDAMDRDLSTCSAEGVVEGVHVYVSVSRDVATGAGGVSLYAS